MGSLTGLSTSAYALGPLSLPHFARPTSSTSPGRSRWRVAVAVVAFVVVRARAGDLASSSRDRSCSCLPSGLVVAGLAIAFSKTTDKGVNEVLFSGQDALPGLVAGAGTWSLGALALLIVFKGLAWAHLARQLPGRPDLPGDVPRRGRGRPDGLAPARLRHDAGGRGRHRRRRSSRCCGCRCRRSCSRVVLTSKAGPGPTPLIIVGVVVAYLTTMGCLGGEPNRASDAATASRFPGARRRRHRVTDIEPKVKL